MNLKQKYIGNRQFYERVLRLLIPMIAQNLITNFVSMLDNIMVGRIGTDQMSGVSIVNQYVFIFGITIFGAVSGPSIFGAQFFGKGDYEGQKYTARYRIIICAIIIAIFAVVIYLYHDWLIMLFIAKDDPAERIAATLGYAREYMMIMMLGLLPWGIGQAYSSVIRESGETKVPMYASIAAVVINLVLDLSLIPFFGVKGAAVATVVAKIIEAIIIIGYAHIFKERNAFAVGLYKGLFIPRQLFWQILIKGTPLLFNEFLWVIGMSLVAKFYSKRGLDVVAARNIASTLTNLFNVGFIQLGGCIAIMVGNKLGEGKIEEAVDIDNKLVFFSLALSTTLGIICVPFAFLFPLFYNTEPVVRHLATIVILLSALAMPIWSYTNACYFTIRSGGRTGITFLFDFIFTWIIMIPLGAYLAYFTNVDFITMFAIVTFSEFLKVFVGYFMVRSKMWVRTIVN